MFQNFVDSQCYKLAQAKGYEIGRNEYQIMRYGFITFSLFIVKTVLLAIIALILGILPDVVILMLLFGILRQVGGGIHLKSSVICTAIGFIFAIGGAYMSRVLPFNQAIAAVVMVLCLGIGLIYAPYSKLNKEETYIRKQKITYLAIIIVLGMIVLLPGNGALHEWEVTANINPDKLRNIIVISIAAASLTLLPIKYKLVEGGY